MEEVKQENKKSKKGVIIGIIVLLLAIAVVVTGILLKNDKSNNNTSEIDNKNANKEQLKVYKSEEDDVLCTKKDDDICNKVAFTIYTDDKAEIHDVYSSNIVLFKEGNTLKIYDHQTDKTKELKLVTDRKNFELAMDEDKIVGIVYYNEKDVDEYTTIKEDLGYYNIKEDKKLYEGKGYTDIEQFPKNYLEATIEGTEEKDNADYVVALVSGTEEKTYKEEKGEVCKYFDIEETKKSYFIIEYDGCTGGSTDTIYTKDLEKIVDNKEMYEYSIYDENVDLYKNNKLITYDIDGKEIKESKTEIKNVIEIEGGYAFYIENNKLKVTDGQDYTEELCDWSKGYYYHWMISGYYDEGSLDNEEEKDAGIYLVIGYEEDEESPGFEVYFNPKDRTTKKWELKEIGGYAKPVLYLYPTKKTNITVSFENKNNLTTTYPKYKDKWEVTAYPNGDLYDKDGKYYYGLYWEEKKNHNIDFSEGFYVTKENAINFLEEKLAQIGLNNKERNEFIMYWLPILEKNEKNLVYFELTEERDQNSKLNITPKPDSLLRVAIHVKKVNKESKIKEQKIQSFKRNGFVAIEWGGVIHK